MSNIVASDDAIAVDDPFANSESVHSGDNAHGVMTLMELAGKDLTLLSLGDPLTADLSDNKAFGRAVVKPSVCAICLEKIAAPETSLVKGCDHNYCVTCILRWASYKTEPWCPQCRLPFTSLYLYRSLDGRLNDYLVEESVCLLLRAKWFKGLPPTQEVDEVEDYHYEDDCYEEYYYTSSMRLGNRRWGDSGYVRGGRKEARPVGIRQVSVSEETGSSSREAKGKGVVKEPKEGKGKGVVKEPSGRRAKRAQKREAADTACQKQHG